LKIDVFYGSDQVKWPYGEYSDILLNIPVCKIWKNGSSISRRGWTRNGF